MGPFVYIVHSAVKAKKLNKLLVGVENYTIRDEKGERVEGLILDTFDNALLKKDLMLLSLAEGLVVVDLKEGSFAEQEFIGDWRFAGDIPTGPVAEILAEVSLLRAFLPLAKVKIRQDKGALIDDEGKTRARYTNLTFDHGESVASLGIVTSLRGYQTAYNDLVILLQESGVSSLESTSELYHSLGIKRYNYTSKPVLSLDAEAPAKETAALIVRSFVDVARANEPGVIADYDTEFLHDYRVSFRKVRSVLSLFKGVFSADKTTELKAAFAAVMQSTNRLRDLDVYLMEKDLYFSMVPEPALGGLNILFDYFAKERKRELKNVRKTLTSEAYEENVAMLAKFFVDTKKIELGPKGKLPSKVLASKLVLKRYSQVCRIAGSIDKTTKDEIVHELRISCKKLRYLMEFVAPLYNQDNIKKLIKTLKVLQDNLGKFNDYSVQQAFLRQVLDHDLKRFKGNEMRITESIGALTAMLYRLQKKERNQVMKNFTRFNSDETRLLFKESFQQKGDV